MELALVKNQINPHFLFNTINNIDVMIAKDAGQASAYLNKLSDIMRFMLYETKTEKIPLSKELTYIEKYIDLQKIRTSNINYVNYHVEGDGGNLVIAPMLFIPFIENAFKHAENKKLDNAVNIKLTLSKEMITFECENKFSESASNNDEQSGLGNELIAKRLQLLYPNKHTLDVSNKNQTYHVKLVVLPV
ncbi:MAG TPA: sensor histidine kinase [Bacteroidia bacterium]|nr:sensor histidine kinase [Bacteroidia bacterium]